MIEDHKGKQDDELTIEAEVHEVQWHDASYRASITLPAAISESFNIFGSHQDFLAGIGVLKLWDSGRSEGGARDAINLKIHELIENGTAEDADVAEYRFGSRFLETVLHWGFGSRGDYAALLIESCARIVVDKPKNSVEPFRVDSNASSDQRVRSDGALAFRTHLTKKGAGFRLMLWKTDDGLIEFANVGDKDELEIH
jgi:hypothetical protein